MTQSAAPGPVERLPIWVRLMDAGALVALAFAALGVLLGGFVLYLGPYSVAVHSPLRVAFICAALIAVRHAAHPASPLHRRFHGRQDSSVLPSPAAIAWGAAATRVAILAVGYFAVLTFGVSATEGGFQVSSDRLLNLPARFDAGWYGGLAIDGYYFQGRFDRQQNVAFFPAYPLLLRAGGALMGASSSSLPRDMRMTRALWAGVFISILAFFWGAHYLARLARDTIGDARAADAVALLAAYPFAVFFSAPYTESVFLLGAVGAFHHFRRAEWLRSAGWGVLVGLTRPNGCFLSAALAALAVEQWWRRGRTDPARLRIGVGVAAMPGVGMLGYSAYVHHLTGSWFGWARLHEAWGRSFEGWIPIQRAMGWLLNEPFQQVVGNHPFEVLNTLGLLFALGMIWPVVRRLGPACGVFVAVNVIPPLMAGGVLSMGRITATLFPLFLALAVVLPPRAVPTFVIAFAAGQGLIAALFFTWRPMF